jgi:hypothetical protein
MEGILNDLQPRSLVWGHDHFHDVESKGDVRVVEHPQPGEGAAGDSALLIGVDGAYGTSEVFALARFYFDEDKRLFVAADDVDFAAAPTAKIAIENLITILSQEPAGQFLAPCPPNMNVLG